MWWIAFFQNLDNVISDRMEVPGNPATHPNNYPSVIQHLGTEPYPHLFSFPPFFL